MELDEGIAEPDAANAHVALRRGLEAEPEPVLRRAARILRRQRDVHEVDLAVGRDGTSVSSRPVSSPSQSVRCSTPAGIPIPIRSSGPGSRGPVASKNVSLPSSGARPTSTNSFVCSRIRNGSWLRRHAATSSGSGT